MLFIAIMFLTTSCVAGAAAFFSVYGLAHTFQAAFWSVVFMGGSLEAGKLMITSYLYRYKDTMTWGRKTLGVAFVFGLMLITSLGIYGYLADAYQSGSTDKKQIDATMVLKKEEQANLQKRKSEIDDQIARVPDKDTRGKQRLITQFGPEVNTINKRLIEITAELREDAHKQITTDSHVGPIVFIAKIVGLDPDQAMSYFILFIIFMFDPVAIYLTVATNEAIAKYKKDREVSSEKLATFKAISESDEFTVANALKDYAHVDVRTDDPELEPDGVALFKGIAESDQFTAKAAHEAFGHLAPTPISDSGEVYIPDPAEELVVAQPLVPLEETFTAHPVDEVEPEAETEAAAEDPIEELKDIYEDAKSNDTQNPLDRETVSKIEKFFAKQQLIKNVRTGNLNQ